LALQGSVSEHLAALRAVGAVGRPVRNAADLAGVDRLILPGGESTTMAGLLAENGLGAAIVARIRGGLPVWGTCAGMILLARRIEGQEQGGALGLMDITVRRNAYGRQIDSFTTAAVIPEIGGSSLTLVFIRAPYITETGAGVRVLLELNGHIVAARQENVLATSFHPELTADTACHRYFLNM
jgi:5'-phosphate synthase pdxT subunit